MKRTKWSSDEKEKLIIEYKLCNGCVDTLCQKLPSRTKSSIKTMCRDLQLRHRKKWTDIEIEQLKLLYSTTNNCVLEKIFNTNYRNIEFKANSLSLYKDKKHNLRKLLDGSNSSMYWMGFIYTDGGFYYNKRSNSITMSIELSTKDYTHLVAFSNYIDMDITKIKIRERMSFGEQRKYCSVNISDIDTILEICKIFDIHRIKTYNPPSSSVIEKMNDHQIMSILCGMIDGDGYANINGGVQLDMHKSWKEFLLSIANRLTNNYSTSMYKNMIRLVFLKRGLFLPSKLKEFAIQNNIPLLDRKWSRIK